MSKPTNVLLIDDHPVVRQGLALMIDREPDLRVCGEAEEAEAALYAIAFFKPDIIVLDLSLKGGSSGMEVLRCIRQTDSNLRILVLSMYDDMAYAERALKAGANGYIMKQEATERVLVAMRRIIAGEVYVSDRVASKMLKRLSRGTSIPLHSPVDDLTNREMEVFRLIGEGRGTREISDQSAVEREDRGDLPGAHQGENGSEECTGIDAAGHSVGAERA